MTDTDIQLPFNYQSILNESQRIGFNMPSDLQTGSLLRTLVSSKPAGKFLELGTGTGLSLSWIAEGMDASSSVITIDNNEEYLAIVRRFFDSDDRITIVCANADEWLAENTNIKFDLIFADAWPGKYSTLEGALSKLKPGALYIIDDMLPQPNWPEGHGQNVENLLMQLESWNDITLTKMNWSTGIVIISKK